MKKILMVLVIACLGFTVGYAAERTQAQVIIELKAVLYDIGQLEKQAEPLKQKAQTLQKELQALQQKEAKADKKTPPAAETK